MAGRLAKAKTVPVGTPAWVANERTQVRQLLDQDVEDFAYFARNEFEWLNEHMLEIFERTASHQLDMIQLMKTPAKIRARTPRTGLRKRFASPTKKPTDGTPGRMLERPPQPLFDVPQASKERFEQSMVSLNEAADAIVNSSRENSPVPEEAPKPEAREPEVQQERRTARAPKQERDSGIWTESQSTQGQSNSFSQQSQSFSQTLSHVELSVPQRLSQRTSNQSEVYEDARSSPAPGNDSFETAAQNFPVRQQSPAKENTKPQAAQDSYNKELRMPLIELPGRVSENDRVQKRASPNPVKLRSPDQNEPPGSPPAPLLTEEKSARYSPITTHYRLPSPRKSPLQDRFEIRHDSKDSAEEMSDIETEHEQEEMHEDEHMSEHNDEHMDEHMGDDEEEEHEQDAQQEETYAPQRSSTRSPVKTKAATPQSTRVTRSSVARQVSATPARTPAPTRHLEKLHSEDEQPGQDSSNVEVPGAFPKESVDPLQDFRKRSFRESGIASNNDEKGTGSRKVSRSSYTTKVPIKTDEDEINRPRGDLSEDEISRIKRERSKSTTHALLEKIGMLNKRSDAHTLRQARQSTTAKTPKASTRDPSNDHEGYSYYKTPSNASQHSQSTRSDFKHSDYDVSQDFKTPNYRNYQDFKTPSTLSSQTDLLRTEATKRYDSLFSPEENKTVMARNSSTPNKEPRLVSDRTAPTTVNRMRESPVLSFKTPSQPLDHANSPPATHTAYPETPITTTHPPSSPSNTPAANPPSAFAALRNTTASALHTAASLLLPTNLLSSPTKSHPQPPPEMREWRRSPNPQSLDEQLRQLRNDWDAEDATANYTKEIEITPNKAAVIRPIRSSKSKELRLEEEARLERERKEREERERIAAEEAERLRIELAEKEERRLREEAAEAERLRAEEAEAEAERIRMEAEAEAERIRIAEKAEAARREAEAELKRKEQEEQRRAAERERQRKEKAEQEARLEAERKRRIAAEELEKEKARVREIAKRELERKKREEEERLEMQRLEEERAEKQRLEEERAMEERRRKEEERRIRKAKGEKDAQDKRAMEAEKAKLEKELNELKERLREEKLKAEAEEAERQRAREEEMRKRREEAERRRREEEARRKRAEEEEQRRREEEEQRKRQEEEQRKREEEEHQRRLQEQEQRRAEEEHQRMLQEQEQQRLEEEQRRLEEEEQQRLEEEEYQRRAKAAAERAAREREAAREVESDEESKTSQPSRPASRMQKPSVVPKTQRTLRPPRGVPQPPKPVLVKTASQREMESKKHMGQPSTASLASALKDTFGASQSQPTLTNASSFTSINSQQSTTSLRTVSQQASTKSLKALDSANAARKKQQEDAERRAAQREKIAKQRLENQKRAVEREEAKKQLARQKTVEREMEPKKKASQAPPSAGRNLLSRAPAQSNLRKQGDESPPGPKKRPLPDQEYGTIKVVQPDAKRQRSEEYEQHDMGPPIRASAISKNSKVPHGYNPTSKSTIKAISSTNTTTTTTIATKSPGDALRHAQPPTTNPKTPSDRLTSLKAPPPSKPSPTYPPGDLIDLPDIPSDSDSDSGRDGKAFLRPEWAESPNLQAALATQQAWNPEEIFGPMPPLQMEEIFRGRDRGRFRARTSSANWSGNDRLTSQEIEADLRARRELIEQGRWDYGMTRELRR